MIELKHKDRVFNIKNKPSEVSLREVQEVVNVINNGSDYYFKTWLNVIRSLCDSEDVADFILEEDFHNIVKSIGILNVSTQVQEEIEIDGYKFKAETKEGGDLIVRAMDMSDIEVSIKESPEDWIAIAVATVYKGVGPSSEMDFGKKVAMMKESLTADVCIPVLNKVNAKFIENVIRLKKAYEQDA